MKCKECNTEIGEGARFCPVCGEPQPYTAPDFGSFQGRSTDYTPLKAVIGIVAVLALLLCGSWFIASYDNPSVLDNEAQMLFSPSRHRRLLPDKEAKDNKTRGKVRAVNNVKGNNVVGKYKVVKEAKTVKRISNGGDLRKEVNPQTPKLTPQYSNSKTQSVRSVAAVESHQPSVLKTQSSNPDQVRVFSVSNRKQSGLSRQGERTKETVTSQAKHTEETVTNRQADAKIVKEVKNRELKREVKTHSTTRKPQSDSPDRVKVFSVSKKVEN